MILNFDAEVVWPSLNHYSLIVVPQFLSENLKKSGTAAPGGSLASQGGRLVPHFLLGKAFVAPYQAGLAKKGSNGHEARPTDYSCRVRTARHLFGLPPISNQRKPKTKKNRAG